MRLAQSGRAIACLAAAAGTHASAHTALNGAGWTAGTERGSDGDGRVIGTAVFRFFVLPFEVASVLLLAALVGAIVLTRQDRV